MDSPFERLSPDTREEWRTMAATQAFIETMRQYRKLISENTVLATQSQEGDLNSLRFYGGEIQALDWVIDLARKETAGRRK